MSKPIQPFAEDASSTGIGGLTVENGTASIALYGQTDLTRDQAGLAKVRALLALMQSIESVLAGEADLPAKVAPPKPARAVKNPFS